MACDTYGEEAVVVESGDKFQKHRYYQSTLGEAPFHLGCSREGVVSTTEHKANVKLQTLADLTVPLIIKA